MNKKLKFSIIAAVSLFTIGVIAFLVSNSQEQAENSEVTVQTPEVKVNPNFSRPEERGEDFSKLETSEIVNIISDSNDEIEKRKAAKVIGDRDIAGTLKLTSMEKESINKVTEAYLEQSKSTDSNKRTEAKQQIERLWRTSVPELLKNIGNPDPTIAELAAKSLILMRDENIINEVLKIAKTTQDNVTKQRVLFVLTKMKEQRTSLIPGRECMSQEESDKLYKKLVEPAILELQKDIKT